jgi:hypothetical protein
VRESTCGRHAVMTPSCQSSRLAPQAPAGGPPLLLAVHCSCVCLLWIFSSRSYTCYLHLWPRPLPVPPDANPPDPAALAGRAAPRQQVFPASTSHFGTGAVVLSQNSSSLSSSISSTSAFLVAARLSVLAPVRTEPLFAYVLHFST